MRRDSEETRKALMIAMYFPPAGGVGTFRTTKFVKYLSVFGWKPVVLTVGEAAYPKVVWIDRELEKDVPQDIRVYRTRIWHNKIINDEGIRWIPFLLFSIVKVIRMEHPKIIYLTGGPFFPLVVGPIAKLLFRLPYVVDLRDPWRLARCETSTHCLKSRLGKFLTNIAEPLIIKFASKVICVSTHMYKEYLKAYPCHSNKFLVITNGYDPNDIAKIEPAKFTNFTVAYVGKFRTSEAFRNPTPFLQAMKILQRQGIDIHYVHVGVKEEEIIALAKKNGVVNLIDFIGPCSYRKALAYTKGADLLLLIGGGQKTEQTGKVFDYLGSNRPILALASADGGIAEIIKNAPNVKLIESKNPETIASAIEEIYHGRQEFILENRVETKYHRKNLTRTLAQIFDEITTNATCR